MLDPSRPQHSTASTTLRRHRPYVASQAVPRAAQSPPPSQQAALNAATLLRAGYNSESDELQLYRNQLPTSHRSSGPQRILIFLDR
ncbi:MAG: hypothetical protein M1812_003421 [Candelaria pacifica]|nr:MAG: hypothetical protein M1812_003421 [Candelaria pacifica]